MFHESGSIRKYSLSAVDEEDIGKVKDFYFDDRFWVVRYLVADTGSWLSEKLVLVSPHAVTSVNGEDGVILTDLTKARMENSPSADEVVPVSRQYEIAINEYYGWPQYWYSPYVWGAYVPPVPVEEGALRQEEQESWESHLRSVREVTGYGVEAADGGIGHVADFLVDDEDWSIRYLVIDTRDWWPGKHVLMSPQWSTGVDWAERRVRVELTREAIESAPEYDRDAGVTREYEIGLWSHYGKDEGA